MEESYKIKTYEELYHELQIRVFGKIISPTDANNGSALCSLLEAAARVISEAYLHCQIGYSYYLNELVESAFGIKKIEGKKAKGFVIFSTEKDQPVNSEVYIPIGTEVSAGEFIYVTTAGGFIEKGKEQSGHVPIEAKETGEKSNVPAGAIKTILSGIHSKVATVTNPMRIENGTSTETQAELRNRFVHYIRGLQRTNYYGVKEAALRAGAYHVNVVLCAPPKDIITKKRDMNSVNNFSETTEYNVNCAVYVCNAEGDCSIDLLEDVRAMLIGEGTPENSGYKPAGVKLAVAPIKLDRRFEEDRHNLEVKVRSDLSDKEEAKEKITKTILSFFQGFSVGQSLILSDLIVAIRCHSWITDVIIVNPKPQEGADNPAATAEDSLLIVKEEDIKVTVIS